MSSTNKFTVFVPYDKCMGKMLLWEILDIDGNDIQKPLIKTIQIGGDRDIFVNTSKNLSFNDLYVEKDIKSKKEVVKIILYNNRELHFYLTNKRLLLHFYLTNKRLFELSDFTEFVKDDLIKQGIKFRIEFGHGITSVVLQLRLDAIEEIDNLEYPLFILERFRYYIEQEIVPAVEGIKELIESKPVTFNNFIERDWEVDYNKIKRVKSKRIE